MTIVIYKNQKAYLADRTGVKLAPSVRMTFVHADGSKVKGYVTVNGCDHDLDALGETMVSRTSIIPVNKICVFEDGKEYVCEELIRRDALLFPGTDVSEETLLLMRETEALTSIVEKLEYRVKALEDISYGTDVFK